MPAFNAPTEVAFVGGRGLKRYFWNDTTKGIDDLIENVTATTIENWFEPQGPVNLGFTYFNI